MIVEGQRVAYAGDGDLYLRVGDTGKVIAVSGSCAHVMWRTGAVAGQISLVEQDELVPDRAPGHIAGAASGALFDDTLDMPTTPTISVRATYDALGEDGLLSALNEAGHLAMMTEYVEEAVGMIVARLKADPTLSPLLGQLEVDESESLVGRVASVLLADRLQEG